MKKIKRILLSLLLVLGFVMQSEMFQIECITFRTGYYLSSGFSYQTEEERIELINELTTVAKNNNVEVFTTTVETIDMIDNRLTVYGNEAVYEQVYIDKNLECISEDLNYKTHMDKLIKENEEEIRALLWEALRI